MVKKTCASRKDLPAGGAFLYFGKKYGKKYEKRLDTGTLLCYYGKVLKR